jgi:hypothetical protein
MRTAERLLWSLLAIVALLSTQPAAAHAQGQGKYKHYTVTTDRAISVSRTVLVNQGYSIVRIERIGPSRIIYYRRGNMGRGKGKGPVQKMIIRQVRDRVIFEETEPSVLVDIDVKLKL